MTGRQIATVLGLACDLAPFLRHKDRALVSLDGIMGDANGAQGLSQNIFSLGATFTLH